MKGKESCEAARSKVHDYLHESRPWLQGTDVGFRCDRTRIDPNVCKGLQGMAHLCRSGGATLDIATLHVEIVKQHFCGENFATVPLENETIFSLFCKGLLTPRDYEVFFGQKVGCRIVKQFVCFQIF